MTLVLFIHVPLEIKINQKNQTIFHLESVYDRAKILLNKLDSHKLDINLIMKFEDFISFLITF